MLLSDALGLLALLCLAGAAVEGLSRSDLDNLTVPAAVVVLAWLLIDVLRWLSTSRVWPTERCNRVALSLRSRRGALIADHRGSPSMEDG